MARILTVIMPNSKLTTTPLKLFLTINLKIRTRKDLEEFIEQKGDINLDRFLVFVQNHHSLLFPAFQMQLALKQNILGVRFWEKASDRRVRLSQKKYVTIKEILEMQAIQAKADSMKGLLVSTNTGKLAIRSIGTAHDRRTKYDSDDPNRSNDSQDGTITNTVDNSHGNCKLLDTSLESTCHSNLSPLSPLLQLIKASPHFFRITPLRFILRLLVPLALNLLLARRCMLVHRSKAVRRETVICSML